MDWNLEVFFNVGGKATRVTITEDCNGSSILIEIAKDEIQVDLKTIRGCRT